MMRAIGQQQQQQGLSMQWVQVPVVHSPATPSRRCPSTSTSSSSLRWRG